MARESSRARVYLRKVMTMRNKIDNHKLIQKPERPKPPKSPRDAVAKPKKALSRPLRRKARARRGADE